MGFRMMPPDERVQRTLAYVGWGELLKQDLLAKGFVEHDPARFQAMLKRMRVAGDAPDTRVQRFFQVEGDPLPLKAKQRLIFPSLFGAESLLAQYALADWQDTPAHLRRFAAQVCESLRRGGMPFFVTHACAQEVRFAHSKFGASLLPDEWQLVHAVGFRLAEKNGLSLCLTGDGAFVDLKSTPLETPFASDPVRLSPRAILARHK